MTLTGARTLRSPLGLRASQDPPVLRTVDLDMSLNLRLTSLTALALALLPPATPPPPLRPMGPTTRRHREAPPSASSPSRSRWWSVADQPTHRRRSSQDVDFTTVGLNTIALNAEQAVGDRHVLGDLDPRRSASSPPPDPVGQLERWTRPRRARPARHVLDTDDNGVTVRDTMGNAVSQGVSVSFTTPISNDSQALFLDTVPGPPSVRVRNRAGVSATDVNATYLETADGDRFYFYQQIATQQGALIPPGGVEYLPGINKYSDAGTRWSIVVHFNQPIIASADNITSEAHHPRVRAHRRPRGLRELRLQRRAPRQLHGDGRRRSRDPAGRGSAGPSHAPQRPPGLQRHHRRQPPQRPRWSGSPLRRRVLERVRSRVRRDHRGLRGLVRRDGLP